MQVPFFMFFGSKLEMRVLDLGGVERDAIRGSKRIELGRFKLNLTGHFSFHADPQPTCYMCQTQMYSDRILWALVDTVRLFNIYALGAGTHYGFRSQYHK